MCAVKRLTQITQPQSAAMQVVTRNILKYLNAAEEQAQSEPCTAGGSLERPEFCDIKIEVSDYLPL